MYCIALQHCTKLNYITSHYITLHCIALHYIASHTTLQYIHYSTYITYSSYITYIHTRIHSYFHTLMHDIILHYRTLHYNPYMTFIHVYMYTCKYTFRYTHMHRHQCRQRSNEAKQFVWRCWFHALRRYLTRPACGTISSCAAGRGPTGFPAFQIFTAGFGKFFFIPNQRCKMMHICIYIIHIHLHITYIDIYIYIHIHLQFHIHTYIYIYSVYIYIYIYTCTYIILHIYIYVQPNKCVSVDVYTIYNEVISKIYCARSAVYTIHVLYPFVDTMFVYII